jgi:dihydrofolate reductase
LVDARAERARKVVEPGEDPARVGGGGERWLAAPATRASEAKRDRMKHELPQLAVGELGSTDSQKRASRWKPSIALPANCVDDPGINPIGLPLNTQPKYVASTTLADPQWAETTVLSGDVAAAVGELKAKPGREVQVHGSGALIRWLLESDLVDQISLLIVPVLLGQGRRLFPDTGPDIALDLVDS